MLTNIFAQNPNLEHYALTRYLQIFFPRCFDQIENWTFFLSIFQNPKYFWGKKNLQIAFKFWNSDYFRRKYALSWSWANICQIIRNNV